jgi:hypothetical protein
VLSLLLFRIQRAAPGKKTTEEDGTGGAEGAEETDEEEGPRGAERVQEADEEASKERAKGAEEAWETIAIQLEVQEN